MEKFFKLKENGTDVKTELLAGLTTFMTMSYILIVNPMLLSKSGMSWDKVFSATAISSIIACVAMALLANMPYALAPGMGMNAFFSYTVCIGMGYSWRYALTAVFVEGIIFIVLSLTNIREAIVNSIPANIKKAIGAGIGLFIAYIGLKNAKVVVGDKVILSVLSKDWYKGEALVALIGIVITTMLIVHKVKGALLIGIIITTVIGIPFGITTYIGGKYYPTTPYFCEFAFKEIFRNGKSIADFLFVMFTFLFCDMFNTVGTLIACADGTDMIREDGSIRNCKQVLLADAIGTTAGAGLGTSTVTTYVESVVGIAQGGRTGLTAITVAVLFGLSLFLTPLFGSIPAAATAPALIIVGIFMIKPIIEITWDDISEAVPAFICIIIMVCGSGIAEGIEFAVLSWVIIRILSGKLKEVSKSMWCVFIVFIAKIILEILN